MALVCAAESEGYLGLAIVGGVERVDEDVGQRDAEGVGDIEAESILQPRQAAADLRVSRQASIIQHQTMVMTCHDRKCS